MGQCFIFVMSIGEVKGKPINKKFSVKRSHTIWKVKNPRIAMEAGAAIFGYMLCLLDYCLLKQLVLGKSKKKKSLRLKPKKIKVDLN